MVITETQVAEIKPVSRLKRKVRGFSAKQLRQWIVDDQLTEAQQRRIDAILLKRRSKSLNR